MAGSEITPGFEMTGGSLGHGLGQAVGMALGARLDRRPSRIFNLLSDGELQEGATWEARDGGLALSARQPFRVYRLQQSAGGRSARSSAERRACACKWEAFGWDTQRINGNDVGAIVKALEAAKKIKDKPHAIVLDTLMGKGVRSL